jgi:hypothetical protein
MLLGLAAAITYVVVLVSTSSAQQTCSNPNPVLTNFTGTTTQQSPPFTTTGSAFVVSVNTAAIDPTQPLSLSIDVVNSANTVIGTITITQAGATTQQFSAPPGTYTLNVTNDQNASYNVTVNDCTGNNGGATTVGPPPTVAQGSTNTPVVVSTITPSSSPLPESALPFAQPPVDVLPPVTTKPLPNTLGGADPLVALMVTGMLLIGALVLAVGIIRAGRRS